MSEESITTKTLGALTNNPLVNGLKDNPIVNFFKENKTAMQVLKISIVCVCLILFFVITKIIVVAIYKAKMRKPWLIRGSKNAKNSLNIPQDPSDPNSIPTNRSDNETDGTEFTYSLWMVIENFVYKQGKWKHIFHKGNNTAYPNQAPGVWLKPEENTVRVYMNTHEDILEYIDIDNIPIKKWVHLGIVLKEKKIDIYFNGKLKKRQVLKGIPRQNYGDIWVNLFGGFEGYVSKFRYYQWALEYNEIEDIVSAGPSSDTCGSSETPGYLNHNWWSK